MSLDREFLEYPMRRHGMDHDRYEWSMLADRTPLRWPGEKPLALWINCRWSTSRSTPAARASSRTAR